MQPRAPATSTPLGGHGARPTGEPAPGRYDALDVARAVALLMLPGVHLVGKDGGSTAFERGVTGFMTTVEPTVAALFCVVAGISWAIQAERAGATPGFRRYLLGRALALGAFGALFHVLFWATEILVPIALMMALSVVVLGRGARVAATWALLFVAATPVVTRLLGGYAVTDWMANGLHAADLAFGWVTLRYLLFDGNYPIVAWMAFPLAGMVFWQTATSRARQRVWCLGAAGTAVVTHTIGAQAAPGVGGMAGTVRYLAEGWTPSSALFLVTAGSSALSIVAALLWQRGTAPMPSALRPIVLFGRASLSHYVLHIVVGYAGLRLWFPQEDWPVIVGFWAMAAYLAAGIPLTVVWFRHHTQGPVEMLWARTSRRPAPHSRANAASSPSDVEVRRADGQAGVFARRPFAAGAIVLPLDGCLVAQPTRYTLQPGPGEHLAASSPAECPWVYLNHSCAPNVAIDASQRVVIAQRPIVAGDELRFDYNMTEGEIAEPFACRCGAPECVGTVRGFMHLPAGRQQALLAAAGAGGTPPGGGGARTRDLQCGAHVNTLAPRASAAAVLEPGACALVHEYFQRAARRWPDRVAVDVPPGRTRAARTLTTYGGLEGASNVLARRLAPHVGGEVVVGILLARESAHLYAAQLGVLKAGAAYACLDVGFPAERIRDILHDADVRVLLTDAAGIARLHAEGNARDVMLDVTSLTAAPGEDAAVPAPAWLGPSSLAYLIYTSGSTGRPKGVMIEHRGVANLIASDLDEFALEPDARVAQNSSPAYDSSVEETWLALAAGATLVVMDDDAVRLGPDLVRWLHEERVTVFCPPPTLLRATGCLEPLAALPLLSFLYLGGEALPQDLADRWARGRLLINGYGPTECTVTCTREAVVAGEPVSIGRPLPNTAAWVLDETLRPVSDGTSGELWIGGIGVARGYWRRPELTADRFRDLPGLGRAYRSGDLAHRDASGRFFYHGRLDGQVKVRGYRVELGEIEAHMAGCVGVRAAGCCLQDADGHGTLVAFVVPTDPAQPPPLDGIRASLARALPSHMVPARIALIEALPTTVGGKLDRLKLPALDVTAPGELPPHVPPRTTLEACLADALGAVRQGRAAGIHDDFFDDLGGDSLTAAEYVTRLRDTPATAWVTVRDVYQSRTIARLAAHDTAAGRGEAPDVVDTARDVRPRAPAFPWLVTVVQATWLGLLGACSAVGVWWTVFVSGPWVVSRLGAVEFLVLAPVIGLLAVAAYTGGVVLLAVVAKRLLIGRYEPGRIPAWSAPYLRCWMVEEVARFIPWGQLEGTPGQIVVLRALGARIGQRVHIHRGVDLRRGGWDLLDIADDVTLSREAAVRVVDLEDGHLVFGPVRLEAGATLETRAGVAGDTVVGAGSCLTALSCVPRGTRVPPGERWDGVPAVKVGLAPPPPALDRAGRELTPATCGLALMAGRAAIGVLLAVPSQALLVVAALAFALSPGDAWAIFTGPAPWRLWGLAMGLVVASVPLTLAASALVTRVVGRVPEGVVSRWSVAYVRVSLATQLLDQASEWLSGTLFWPAWLRLAGMRIGRGSEVSRIIDVVPPLITIGAGTFFADGIYLGGPRIQQGTVTLAATSLGANTFLGNHAVVFAGQALPDDILLGVSTPADASRIRPGSSWFGHPSFELPRREVVIVDRHLTHDPSPIRYANRVLWEASRFALPIVPLVTLVGWTRAIAAADRASVVWFLGMTVPLVTAAAAVTPAVLVLLLKWVLLGRVRPGQHPLWSCWCSRWDFLYVAWAQWARPVLSRLEGTLLLAWYLRAMGMRIGRRVLFGPGFAQVVDPDMITLEDDVTCSAAFQAHTFEDRVLKIDHVVIGRGATVGAATVPLYGAVVGAGARVAAHSVVMKRERLLPRVDYEGVPTRPVARAAGG